MRQLMTALLFAGLLAGVSQAATPVYLWELANVHADLTESPSNSDLIEGFPAREPAEEQPPFAGPEPVLSNEVINESNHYVINDFYQAIVWNDPNSDPNDLALDPNDLRDPNKMVLSLLFSNYCLYQPSLDGILSFGNGARSDGFGNQPGTTGSIDDLNNGVIGPGNTDGLLRDFARSSLVVRYGFSSPTDIGALRVIGGNLNDADTRTFQHYDVWVSTDGLGPAGTYTKIATGVKSGEFGFENIDDCNPLINPPCASGIAQDDPSTVSWFASMTEVRDNDSKILAAGVTDLRIVFYNTGSGSNVFTDPWHGVANEEDPDYIEPGAVCNTEVDQADIDGLKRAFVASVIQEIDVLGPNDDVPWGDIDYNDQQDMIDFAAYQACSGGLTTNGCYRFDQNENDGLDSADLDAFESQMNGPLDPTTIPDQRIDGLEAA